MSPFWRYSNLWLKFFLKSGGKTAGYVEQQRLTPLFQGISSCVFRQSDGRATLFQGISSSVLRQSDGKETMVDTTVPGDQ